jgi:hypothetical protein
MALLLHVLACTWSQERPLLAVVALLLAVVALPMALLLHVRMCLEPRTSFVGCCGSADGLRKSVGDI